MVNANEIKSRMKAIMETQQITTAMQIISASKLRSAMRLHSNNKRYHNMIRSTIKDILDNSYNIEHEYFNHREGTKVAFIVIAADKGLSGDYNKAILELAEKIIMPCKEKYLFTVGSHATNFFKKRGVESDIEFLHISENPSLDDARKMTYDIMELYDMKVLDEVNIIYTSMEKLGKHKPVVVKVLPIERKDFDKEPDMDIADNEGELRDRFDFFPSPQIVANVLTPQYLIGQIYGALVQSSAAEFYERMVAMKKARDNADKMIKEFKYQQMQIRQEKITRELLKISMVAMLEND